MSFTVLAAGNYLYLQSCAGWMTEPMALKLFESLLTIEPSPIFNWHNYSIFSRYNFVITSGDNVNDTLTVYHEYKPYYPCWAIRQTTEDIIVHKDNIENWNSHCPESDRKPDWYSYFEGKVMADAKCQVLTHSRESDRPKIQILEDIINMFNTDDLPWKQRKQSYYAQANLNSHITITNNNNGNSDKSPDIVGIQFVRDVDQDTNCFGKIMVRNGIQKTHGDSNTYLVEYLNGVVHGMYIKSNFYNTNISNYCYGKQLGYQYTYDKSKKYWNMCSFTCPEYSYRLSLYLGHSICVTTNDTNHTDDHYTSDDDSSNTNTIDFYIPKLGVDDNQQLKFKTTPTNTGRLRISLDFNDTVFNVKIIDTLNNNNIVELFIIDRTKSGEITFPNMPSIPTD